MIYTVISRTDLLSEYYKKNDFKEGFFTEEILKYISDTGNMKIRDERIAAYTSLFYSLNELFSIRPKKILRTIYGKPYIQEGVYFSISHSNGLCAVTLSDKVEVGVDIQEFISEKIGAGINGRFLSGFEFYEEDFNINLLSLSESFDGGIILEPIFLDSSISDEILVSQCSDENTSQNKKNPLDTKLLSSENDPQYTSLYYTKKWTGAEAVTKLYGIGFGDLIKNKEAALNAFCDFKTVVLDEKYYLMANALLKSDLK